MDVVELPAPEEYSQWIKPGRDAMHIDRAERLATPVSLKAVRRRGEKTFAMNRRVMSRWEPFLFPIPRESDRSRCSELTED